MTNKITILFFALAILFSGCNTQQKEQQNSIKQINEIETKLINDTTAFISQKKAKQLIELYEIYCNNYPADSLAPEYLFKAGEMAMNINHASRAIVNLNRLEREYPNHPKTPYSIFFQAFVYENQMNNIEKARLYYQKFVDAYPDHELADDAITSINNLGKPLEEIIEGFEKNNSAN